MSTLRRKVVFAERVLEKRDQDGIPIYNLKAVRKLGQMLSFFDKMSLSDKTTSSKDVQAQTKLTWTVTDLATLSILHQMYC